MRFYTCTPVAFGGGPDFFARDSGLLCRGFQAIGCESRAVMPGESNAEDHSDLIRTEFKNLESAEWWRNHNLDAVFLYAWGRPKFRKVAKAIHDAGIFLILNQDSGGLVSPIAGFKDWLLEQWILAGQGRSIKAALRFFKLASRGMTVGIFLTDPLRASHFKYGNIIATVSPKAADSYRKLCRFYGGATMVKRVRVIPHAVESRFHFSGCNKRRHVTCVGRWQDIEQKRPWLLTKVIEALVDADREISVTIVGTVTEDLVAWYHTLPNSHRNHIDICGHVGRDDLPKILNESQVFFSPSAYESFGIAAAEALCSGCSIVGQRSVSMASFDWFISDDSGTLTDGNSTSDYVLAIQQELLLWENNERCAQKISNIWCQRLHADKVAAFTLELFNEQSLRS